MDIANQKKLAETAQTHFDGKFKTIINENRRRYRMQLDAARLEAAKRGLSAIPSVKSTAAVDRYVERSLIEYHQDPDSISYTAKNLGNPEKDGWARWLTETVRYRMNNTFDFFNWHQGSILAGAVDGIEAALVYWRKEFTTEKSQVYSVSNPDGSVQPVPEHVYNEYAPIFPEMFSASEVSNQDVTLDTFWIDQLEPGKDIIWDPQTPSLDINQGQFCVIRLKKTISDLKNLAAVGVLDPQLVTDEILSQYQKSAAAGTNVLTLSLGGNADSRTLDDPYNVNLEEFNRVPLCCMFIKVDNRWMCQFSLDMKDPVSQLLPVNNVWFGGRKVNCLPVVVGTTKKKLWEEAGRSIPETIAPIEDEHSDHINNVNDAAKIEVQGRYRIDVDSDLKPDDLLNRRYFYAEKDSFERIETNFGTMNTLRADDSRILEMNELIPAGVMGASRNVAGKGTSKTLGQTQIGVMASDEKTGVYIMTRNNTFLKKVFWLIAQYEMAFETDTEILQSTATLAGVKPPITYVNDGSGYKQIFDLSVLDFGVNIQINAGLGSQPRYQKADTTMQLTDWGLMHKLPVNTVYAFQQLSALAGYEKDALLLPQQPPPEPPKSEIKLSLSATMAELTALDPNIASFLLQELKAGHVAVDIKQSEAKMNEQRHNGGGAMMPDRTDKVVNGMDDAALAMSAGGQIGGQNG